MSTSPTGRCVASDQTRWQHAPRPPSGTHSTRSGAPPKSAASQPWSSRSEARRNPILIGWPQRSKRRYWTTAWSDLPTAPSGWPTSSVSRRSRSAPPVSAGSWLRHGLETRIQRLLRLEAQAQDDTFVLSEAQVQLLERHGPNFAAATSRYPVLANSSTRTPSPDARSRASARSTSKWWSMPCARLPSPSSTPRRCR